MRHDILCKLVSSVKMSEKINMKWLAGNTPGYVAADLNSLVKEAGLVAVQRLKSLMEEGLEIKEMEGKETRIEEEIKEI